MTIATITTSLIPKTPIGCELIAKQLASQLQAEILEEPITQFLIGIVRYYGGILFADPAEMITTITAQPHGSDMQISRMECRVEFEHVKLAVTLDMNLLLPL